MIRSDRGRWGVLSPCYPWVINTEYKKYNSLLNYYNDNTDTRPTKFLTKRLHVDKSKIVNGLKILLKDYPQFKSYLHSCPKNLQYVNPLHPEFAKMYTTVLFEAKEAINKFKIKGQEVLDKKNKFELLGAKIIGDQAVFDYDARQDVNNIVYGISDEEHLTRLQYVGNMISSYIYLFDKIPEFLISMNENPNIFYIMRKYHTDQISKILCTVNVLEWKELNPENISSLIFKINERIGNLWPFIVFPKALHPGIKKEYKMPELIQMVKYHIDSEFMFKKEIICRLQMLDYAFRPSHKESLKIDLSKADGTESSDDDSISIETLEYENEEDLEFKSTDSFVDKWVIWGEENEQDSNNEPPIPSFESLFEPVPPQPSVPPPPAQPPTLPPAQPPTLPPTQPPTLPPAQPSTLPLSQPPTLPLAQPLPQQKLQWDLRFKPITQTGHIIEPHNPLSPFGKNSVFWKGVKYENILAAIYNQCMLELLPDGVQHRNSANKARNHILAYNKKEECIIWFKDKGIEMLKEFMTTEAYKTKKTQMSMDNLGQLTYLYSRRKQPDVLLEPWIGAIKVDAGIPYLTLMIGGWNCAYQVQLEN